MNTDALRKKMDNKGWARSGGDRTYTFAKAKCSKFDDGTYKMRILPGHTEFNPDGIHMVRYHKIQVRADGEELWVLCKGEECRYLCPLVASIKEAGILGRMRRDLQATVGLLAGEDRAFLPTLWMAEEYQAMGRENRTFVRYRPRTDGEPLPITLVITSKTLLTDVFDLFDLYPDLADLDNGRSCTFTKKRYDYKIIPHKESTPMTMRHLMTQDHYPHLTKFGSSMSKSDAEIADMCQNAWWTKEFEAIGIDLTEDDTVDPTIDMKPSEVAF
jgi:hypothetical protein